MTFLIRPEQPGDETAIHGVVERAFAPMPFSAGDEQDVVDLLRERGELSLSLVAIATDGALVGHVGFSPVTIGGADCGWHQMAPVAVEPGLQRIGIGSALIRAGIEALRHKGARGIGVVGNPVYYERFGFVRVEGIEPPEADAPYFRAMVLAGEPPRGVLRYASAFG